MFLLLLPFSFLYGFVGFVRNFCYDSSMLPAYQSSLPVISVGNIAVGGTGKTPVVDWLVKEYLKQGKHPAVVSRGYSGSYKEDVGIVSAGDGLLMTASECGDEPYLLAQRNPHCRVVVARKRVDGIKTVEASGVVDLILLDDGFQHRAVKRNVDLVLLDSNRPLGNGWPLPAGHLREFPKALQRADFLLMTRAEKMKSATFMDRSAFTSHHVLSDIVTSLEGNQQSVNHLKNLKLLAFAGIAKPESFFASLVDIGLVPHKQLAFADHSDYQEDVLEHIRKAAASADALITTEKDGVKLVADMFELPCYQIGMDIKIDNSDILLKNLSRKIWS
ncbi:MAG: tetraacyldisaccharide 4'-kinase [Thermodesulfobacteriota bacterium]|nr:tetraacyldisaccharide 4'-kinase [Thermodesulfobacteriota bacterium]